MRSHMKTLLVLGVPLALSLGSSDVVAKKKKKKHGSEDVAAAPAATPTPTAEAAPAAAPTQVAQTTTTTTTTTTTAQVAPAAAVTEEPAAPAAAPAPAVAEAPAAAAPPPVVVQPQPRDGVRFRGGISIGGAGEFVSGFQAGMFAVDGRLGVQINKLIGIYVQPHVAIGQGSISGVSGTTGTFAATALIDFTIINRIFVGAGAGFAVANNPYGAAVHFRLGGYPVMRAALDRPRRKGLMLGADMRAFFTQVGPVVEVVGSVGFEAF